MKLRLKAPEGTIGILGDSHPQQFDTLGILSAGQLLCSHVGDGRGSQL